MRVLLDECLPSPLATLIVDHDVHTVSGVGWAGLKNGKLLRRAVANGYEVFVTIDSSLSSQQNLAKHAIGIVVIRSVSNRLADLKPLVPDLIAAVTRAKPGVRIVVSED